MFTGIDDVDWASMGHAYTDSATDVPDLLRDLASDDPARREVALDGMYGAVHHQGDVYDSTVACIPFLFELVTVEAVADRGAVVHLLCSIAGEREPDPQEIGGLFEDEAEDAAFVQPFLDAWSTVRGRADVFLGLLADPDAEVRAAAAAALAHVHPDPSRVLGALRDRLTAERDPQAVGALVQAVGRLGTEHREALGAEAGTLLKDVVSVASHPEQRLAGLVQLARCGPESLPEDLVETVLDVMRLAHEQEAPAEEPHTAWEGPRTDTMVSYLRELEAARRQSVDASTADDLLEELHRALGDRTDPRFELLVEQLQTPDWGQRMAAVDMAGTLLTGWRAPDDLPVALLARQLVEDEPELSRRALTELCHVAPIARVVADILAVCVREWDDTWEPGDWEGSLFGKALEALALQGDQRAVPALAEVLAREGTVPENLGTWVERIGPEAAAPLVPVLHRRLGAAPSDRHTCSAQRLVSALGVLARPESLPFFVEMAESDSWCRSQAVRALARYGPDAAEVAARLRELMAAAAEPLTLRLDAARALRTVTGQAEPLLPRILPLVHAGMESQRWSEQNSALKAAGSLGPAGAPLAPRLRELLPGRDAQPDMIMALWQITGDVDGMLPTLLDKWAALPRTRPAVAACLTEMGPAAASALPLIQEELSSQRRHNNDRRNDDSSTMSMRYDVAADERLLADCRRLVTPTGLP
ncbi:HEAT repeat domain-containing protein [Streptomyces sp. HD]|uniref:HEAT repeat domain-containing protein n=1 Tax=Streptomyces sp. HD TaxID=3020892 RepID=UPI002331102C|nr:HEAT repeat domain-containing protein [Streptomyces sp. HD]MDC0767075.1 HEAT repeat domain-containing protein [Streptomyces sp. HD]